MFYGQSGIFYKVISVDGCRHDPFPDVACRAGAAQLLAGLTLTGTPPVGDEPDYDLPSASPKKPAWPSVPVSRCSTMTESDHKTCDSALPSGRDAERAVKGWKGVDKVVRFSKQTVLSPLVILLRSSSCWTIAASDNEGPYRMTVEEADSK
jgi:hypothetical protein